VKRAFDRFAAAVAKQVAQPWFFACCVMIVLVWAPSFLLFGNVDTWQLVINTTTTIITFLLVALLQNTQDRFERRMKKDQVAERVALALLLRKLVAKSSLRDDLIDLLDPDPNE
jgi:low affinity Fe/Cu permease